MPERREIDTRIIMPVRRPIVFQSMPLSASSWSSTPTKHHHRRTEQRDDRPVELVPDDDAIGDAQDDGRHHHRVEAEKDVRHEVLRRHASVPHAAGRLQLSAGCCQGRGRRMVPRQRPNAWTFGAGGRMIRR